MCLGKRQHRPERELGLKCAHMPQKRKPSGLGDGHRLLGCFRHDVQWIGQAVSQGNREEEH